MGSFIPGINKLGRILGQNIFNKSLKNKKGIVFLLNGKFRN